MRHRYLDWLRVISAFAVVAVHVLTHYLSGFPLKGTEWTVTMIVKHATHFCIPVFFMITGALLIKHPGCTTYGEYLKKRFARIFLPFLIWSFVHWTVINVLVKGKPFSVPEFIKLFLCNGISSQYWYVYATLALYLFLPFIGILFAHLSEKQQKVLITVMVVVNVILPYINELLKYFTNWKITNYNMSSLGAYLSYALTGYALHKMELPRKKTRMLIYLGGAVSWVVMNILVWICSKEKYTGLFSETQFAPSFIMGIAVFIAFKAVCAKKEGPGPSRIVSILSTESYSAYLTHMLCLRLLQIVWPTRYIAALPPFRAAGIMLSEWILALIGCFGIAFLAHKLPKRISSIL